MMEQERGIKTLNPSPSTCTAGDRSRKDSSEKHSFPQRQTSNVRITTTPLATTAQFITKRASLETSTGHIRQASTSINGTDSGHNPLRKLVSTHESHRIESSFYDIKTTATGAFIIPSVASSVTYHPTFQGSSTLHRQGMC